LSGLYDARDGVSLAATIFRDKQFAENIVELMQRGFNSWEQLFFEVRHGAH
jgi:hypothetical protein